MNQKTKKSGNFFRNLILLVMFGFIAISTQAQNSVTVTVNPKPGAATISANAICGTGTVLMTANIGSNANTVEFSEDGGTTVHGTDNTSPYEYTTSSITAGSSVTVHVRSYNSVTGCYGDWTNSAVATANLIPGVATIAANTRCGTGTVVMTANIGANGDVVQFSEDGGTTTLGTDNSSPYTYTTSSITAGSTVTVHVRTYNSTTGCASAWTNSAVATAYAIPLADAGTDPGDITCANPTRTLSGSGGGSYAWSTADGTIDSGANTATPTISAGGTYSLTVTANGCASTNTAEVVVGETATIPGVATIAANTRCGTGTVVMTANIGANGDVVQFSEDGGTTTHGTDNSSPYNYTTSSITAGSTVTVHVRTYNSTTGCASAWTNSAVATAYAIPVADAGTDPGDITCANPTRTLSGSGGGSYAWSTADGTIDSGANTATPTISAGGTYSLTVTVNGCASTNTAEVVVGESGTIPGVATISDNSRCGTGTVLMTAGIGANGDRVDFSTDGSTVAASDATSPYEYTTASITAGSNQTIYVRSYNTSTGCASAWTNTGVATAYVLPTATVTVDDATICNGVATNLNIALTGTANWTIKYKIGATQQPDITNVASSPYTLSVNPSSTTTYTVTEVSDANCTTTY
jgi:mevalonate pyrophosphate decarboxylase